MDDDDDGLLLLLLLFDRTSFFFLGQSPIEYLELEVSVERYGKYFVRGRKISLRSSRQSILKRLGFDCEGRTGPWRYHCQEEKG